MNRHLTATHPLPEPTQLPDPADAANLVRPPRVFRPLVDSALPLDGNPPPQAVLDTLLFNRLPPSHQAWRNVYGDHAGNAFLGQHGALDEVAGGKARGKTAGEADGDEGPCQPA